MICISVAPRSRKLAKADLVNASPHCDLIELCLDHLIKEPDVGDLITAAGRPVLVSCRRKEDGGEWRGSEEERLKLLRQAIACGPAYVELEIDAAAAIPAFGGTKRVVSYTSLDRPLRGVDAVIEEALAVKADVVKFTWPTRTLDAAWPLLHAVTKKHDVPVVGMGLGRAGRTFSLLARKYGSPWIYAALEKGLEAWPDQASVFEMDELYRWREIGPRTRFVGIIGFGSAPEASIRLFNAGFSRLGLNARCLPLALGGLDKLDRMLDVLKVGALIVSGQLSTVMIDFAEHAEAVCSEARYTDLLLKRRDGWTAYDTLGRSAIKSVEGALGNKSAEDRPLERRSVLVVGAGGPARALVHRFVGRGGVVSVTDPDDQAGQRLARRFGVRLVPFANLYDTLTDVVAVTDPAIVTGHRKAELSPSYLRENMLVLDVTRLPEETLFIEEARSRGCRVVEPREVFVNQAAVQFKSLTGRDLPRQAVDDVMG